MLASQAIKNGYNESLVLQNGYPVASCPLFPPAGSPPGGQRGVNCHPGCHLVDTAQARPRVLIRWRLRSRHDRDATALIGRSSGRAPSSSRSIPRLKARSSDGTMSEAPLTSAECRTEFPSAPSSPYVNHLREPPTEHLQTHHAPQIQLVVRPCLP